MSSNITYGEKVEEDIPDWRAELEVVARARTEECF